MKNSSLVIYYLIPALLSFSLTSCSNLKDSTTTEAGKLVLNSPDKKVSLECYLTEEKGIAYKVNYLDKSVILPSPLGIVFADSSGFINGLELINMETSSGADSFQFVTGKANYSKASYNEGVVSFKNKKRQEMQLIFRLYDKGVAFKYYFPEQKNLSAVIIREELTSFSFSGDHECWGMKGYNKDFEGDVAKHSINSLDTLTSFPVTVLVSDSLVVSITEAGLINYAGMNVMTHSKQKNTIRGVLTPLPSEKNIAVKIKAPTGSPWRVLLLAEKPVQLIESNLVMHLNDPCKIKNTSWIKPGKATWTWYSNGPEMVGKEFNGMNNFSLKKYIDYTSEMGFEFFLIDAGWSVGHEHDTLARERVNPLLVVPKVNIKELADYCKSKNIKLGLWMNYASNYDRYDSVFTVLEKWGVSGIKIDFFSADHQDIVNIVNGMVKSAADHHLMLDMHSVYKPTGIARTYPNLMTSEGVKGEEYNKWDKITPTQRLAVPYTRMLAGPMDFTAGGFINVTAKQFKNSYKTKTQVISTRAQQLAMYVVYDSPLFMVNDEPYLVRGQKGADFIKIVPTSWDETIGIDGKIGEHILVARKKGEEWFVGGMSVSPREYAVPLNFLQTGSYEITIWKDGANAEEDAKDLSVENIVVQPNSSLKIKIATAGGFAIRIIKQSYNPKD